MVNPEEVLDYWFGPLANDQDFPEHKASLWFKKSDATDAEIRERFGDAVISAQSGGFSQWREEPRSRLALIILLDQFTRNIFRGDAQAFAGDHIALELTRDGIAQGVDRKLSLIERIFFYLPLEHSESMEVQEESMKAYQGLRDEVSGDWIPRADDYLNYARRHMEIIQRFGRYPHRNQILGRENTPEEAEFLTQPGSGF